MLRLCAPAKLNLFLHITGRRTDGYHDLQTVFQLLDFGDELQFTRTLTAEVTLACNKPELATPDNLVLRAAALLQPYNSGKWGCAIQLNKHLPAGGGLGGGSSDAATTLVALNGLWRCDLEQSALTALARTLGADVPVFIAGYSAWAEGTGEKLQILPLPERWYVVLTPNCKSLTQQIFSHLELTRNSAPIRIPAFPFSGTRNDCQAVASLLHPQIQQALDWLTEKAEKTTGNKAGSSAWADSQARMTGTGSSVFSCFANQAQATEVLAQLPATFSGFVARGVNQSPLYQDFAQKLEQALVEQS